MTDVKIKPQTSEDARARARFITTQSDISTRALSKQTQNPNTLDGTSFCCLEKKTPK